MYRTSLIVEKLDVFHFHLIFSIVITNFSLTCKIWKHFFKTIHQKWKYYREEKQDFEKLLIFPNIKMSAKPKKLLIEELIVIWREEQSLWDVMPPLYRDKNEKDRSLKRVSDFRYFRLKFSLKCEIFFQLTLGILTFQLCF